jgi:hypothetical protein
LAGGNNYPVKGSKLGAAVGSPSSNRDDAIVDFKAVSGKTGD